MNNELDKMISIVLASAKGRSFISNGRFECTLYDSFSSWEKDNNSPALFADANLEVKDLHLNDIYSGLLHVQEDNKLQNKYYATLFIKKNDASNWEHMYNVTNIAIW